MCLSYPETAHAAVSASEAAAGSEHLLQQVKHGAELPKPMMPATSQLAHDKSAHSVVMSGLNG